MEVDPVIAAIGLEANLPFDPEDCDLTDLMFWCCSDYTPTDEDLEAINSSEAFWGA